MSKTKTIFIAGLVAGTLDAVAAILLFAHPVTLHNISNIFRYIASGLIGQGAFANGLVYPFLGLFLHFLIATIWSAVYLLFCTACSNPDLFWQRPYYSPH